MKYIGNCKLCEKRKRLMDSHYLPKKLYSTIRARELRNPNPVMNSGGLLKQISAQYHGYVLCSDCEDRFNKFGEKWILANLPTEYGGLCPLQDALEPLTPVFFGHQFNRYDISAVKAFDLDKLIYFGMSVFWRGAVHDWKTSAGQKAPSVDLGLYKEPIRKFLYGLAPFPAHVVLVIDIWPFKPALPLLYPVITEELAPSVPRYWFFVPGVQYFLFTGSNIPADAHDSNAMKGILTVDLGAANSFLAFLKNLLKGQSMGPKMELMFKEIALIRKHRS